MLVSEPDEENYNDFLYWRRPLINMNGAALDDENPDYWRRRPGNLVGSLFSRGDPLDTADIASASTVSSPDGELPEDDSEQHHDHTTLVDIDGHHDHTTLVDMEETDDSEDDDLALLRGGAGARLLSVLGQLSQHLGPQSRFSAASDLLQNDLQQMRARTGEEAQQESDEGGDASPSQLRLPSSSALQEPQARLCPSPLPPGQHPTPATAAAAATAHSSHTHPHIPITPCQTLSHPLTSPHSSYLSALHLLTSPQVLHSMSSMLRLLSDGVSIEPMWAHHGSGVPRAAVFSGGTGDMVALPFELPATPSNPASPLAVSRLPLVDWRDLSPMEEDFVLDAATARTHVAVPCEAAGTATGEAAGEAAGAARTRVHTHCRCV